MFSPIWTTKFKEFLPIHLWGTSEMNQKLRLLPEGGGWGPKSPSTSRLIHPEQRSVSWMKDLLCRFWRPEAFVVDELGGNFATGKVFLMTWYDHHFIECDIAKDCSQECGQELVETYSGQN